MYYLLNINILEESQVDYWIEKRGVAPIFYFQNTLEDIKKGIAKSEKGKPLKDAMNFVSVFSKINENDKIISIGERNLYIFKQKDVLKEWENNYTVKVKNKAETHLVKGFEIEILKEIDVADCPLVLVTIKSNQWMTRGTFKPIDEYKKGSYFGNCRAIDYLLTDEIIKVNSYKNYLECLSSLEFETLIAKIFEEKGYFVPAYKGGFIKYYDLFCRKNNEKLAIQIKLHLNKEHIITGGKTDLYYCITSDIMDENIKDWKYIQKEISSCPKTQEWLEKCLEWVKIE